MLCRYVVWTKAPPQITENQPLHLMNYSGETTMKWMCGTLNDTDTDTRTRSVYVNMCTRTINICFFLTSYFTRFFQCSSHSSMIQRLFLVRIQLLHKQYSKLIFEHGSIKMSALCMSVFLCAIDAMFIYKFEHLYCILLSWNLFLNGSKQCDIINVKMWWFLLLLLTNDFFKHRFQ